MKPYLPDRFDVFLDAAALGLGGGFTQARDLYRKAQVMGGVLAETKPDVTLGMMHYGSALAVLGARLSHTQTRVVASYRGPFFEHMRHHEHGIRRWTFLWSTVSGVARLADRVFVPSQGTADELRRRFLTPASRIRVIPNGIDLTAAQTAAKASVPEFPYQEADATPLLCAIARLSPEKNLGVLLDAVRLVRQKHPVTLLIVGDGPERGALESRIANTGLADSVRIIGYRANVMPYLHRADLFIHTCLFEGFGYTILEALACGAAVVSTDCPYGPREVLANGECGSLVPMNDAKALAQAILNLLENPTRRLSNVEKGYERAKELSVARMIEAYEREFQELMCTHPF